MGHLDPLDEIDLNLCISLLRASVRNPWENLVDINFISVFDLNL